MSLISTETQSFHLNQGKISAGLARDRLWQVKEGHARLRLLTSGETIGEMAVPESGWFVVPESDYLRVQLIAETDITFESRPALRLDPTAG